GHARRPQVLRPVAEEERLCVVASPVTARDFHDAGTCRTKGDRQELHYPAPCPSLSGICRDAMETLPKGKPAARQAASVCVPGATDWHPPDADRRGPGQPAVLERGVQAALHSRTDRAEDRG